MTAAECTGSFVEHLGAANGTGSRDAAQRGPARLMASRNVPEGSKKQGAGTMSSDQNLPAAAAAGESWKSFVPGKRTSVSWAADRSAQPINRSKNWISRIEVLLFIGERKCI